MDRTNLSHRSDLAAPDEIRRFAEVIALRQAGQVDEADFRRFRVQNGIYGMRGQTDVQMVRVKIPFGRLTAGQLARLGDIAETLANGLGHVTTRQDVQFHGVALADVPALLSELAGVGLTTREAGGNGVRNVTACHLAGVCPGEVFDVTPYAEAVVRFLLRNPMCQNLPRKFKIAFSGCPTDCAFAAIHDIGAVAAVREEGGELRRGFRLYLGGGLGPAPRQAELLEPFTPAGQLLTTCEAIIRLFDRLGNRENRARARLKFLIEKLGIEAFREMVFKERQAVWATRPAEAPAAEVEEAARPVAAPRTPRPTNGSGPAFEQWRATNVVPEKQPGLFSVFVTLPAGDVTAAQFHGLARIAERLGAGEARTTITQNLVLLSVPEAHLPELHAALRSLGLASPGVHRLGDVLSCPGADTCNLAITASHRLGLELIRQLAGRQDLALAGDLRDVHIKISGCPNSCGHHHTAPIGLHGAARKVDGRQVPHYVLMVGGQVAEGSTAFGRPVMRLPARRVPEAIFRLVDLYRSERRAGESFLDWVGRLEQSDPAGLKDTIRAALAEFEELPPFDEAPAAYTDWGQQEAFQLQLGQGECAV